MPSPLARRAFLLRFLPGAGAFIVACGSGGTLPALESPAVTMEPTTPVPTQPGATATAIPPTATPAGGMQFKPTTLPQGGVAIVYLNESASSATVRFGGRQYPMLNDSNRWWTVVGIGAFTEVGLLPVTIVYTPTGKTAQASIVQSINVTDVVYPTENIELDEETAALLAPDIIQAELAKRATIYSGYTAQRMWQGPFKEPARGSRSSPYGEGRSYNGAPVTDYHRGLDFIGDTGSPVFAAATGKVAFTGELKVRGNSIMLDHGVGVFTAYHHLSAINVEEGDVVNLGDRIGDIGSTGLVTGPHLHWEVIVRGIEVDGANWLKGEEMGP